MSDYISNTQAQRRQMLDALGLQSEDELFAAIPQEVRAAAKTARLPDGMSQLETLAALRGMADANTRYRAVLRGAGCYDHFIPPIVPAQANKEEFVTAYTPYQAEMSQGVLQSIFEYQTMICELTGMAAANASVYDGATAAAEAAAMCRDRKRTAVLVSGAVHPDTLAVVRTYCHGAGAECRVAPARDGATDPAALQALLAEDVACVVVQSPNYYGSIEDTRALFAQAHAAGAKAVWSVDALALALLPDGTDVGADVVTGDAQAFGLPMCYGGPSVGFMAATAAMQRRLPGRIVGQTTDAQGRRAFVLTLQAREQHIRREKAQSNICSNQAHCALTASVYMSYMGAAGLREVAESCVSKAHYLAARLTEIPGLRLAYGGEFFHEFVTELPVSAKAVEAKLGEAGVLSGLPLDERRMLWCVTEKSARALLDEVAALVKEACEL